MQNFKNSGWPSVVILFVMMALSAGVAFSCSSSDKKTVKEENDKMMEGMSLDQNNLEAASFPDLSSNFVQRVINGESVEKHLEILKNVNPDTLDDALDTPRKRLTFWINMYNGFTQYFLKKDPSLYQKDRSAFFKKAQIPIAGYKVSMEDVEHGVLRRGATIWSKGYVRIRAFRKNFIQKYAVETVDYRIHFALNCGAKSCPPVVIYEQESIAEQLNANSRHYLNKEVEYNEEENIVRVPALMNWFSADFGGDDKDKRGILREHGALPEGVGPEIKYLPYDWTMMIENYKSY